MALTKNGVIALVAVVAVVAVALIAIGSMSDDDQDGKTIHRVTYYGNGGTCEGKTMLILDDIDYVQYNMFKYEGHTFVSWNTEADGSGTTYQYLDPVPSGTSLYAIWKTTPLQIYSYHFVGDVDFSMEINGTELIETTSFYSPAKIVVNSGSDWTYDSASGTFLGKFKDEDYILKITLECCSDISMEVIAGKPTISFTAIENIGFDGTLTEKKVYYDGNGGKTSDDESTAITNSNIVSSCMFTKDGYTFKNWNTTPEGDGTAYTPGTVAPYGTILYAIWEKSSSE